MMEIKEINQNAVGYFQDILTTYHRINDLERYYRFVESSLKECKEKREKILTVTTRKGIVRIWMALEIITVALSALLALCGVRSVVVYFLFLLFLPALLTAGLYGVYRWRVVPQVEKKYKEAVEPAREECKSVYAKLCLQRQNLEQLSSNLCRQCQNPLAAYIMCQATGDGSCKNVFQAQKYFVNREAFLMSQEDELSKYIVSDLRDSRREASEQYTFLTELDESVAEMLS